MHEPGVTSLWGDQQAAPCSWSPQIFLDIRCPPSLLCLRARQSSRGTPVALLLPSPLDNSLPIDALFPPSAKQALWVLCHCRALAGNPTWSALISERGGMGSRGEAGNLFPEGGGGRSKPFRSEADGRCPPARATIKPSTCLLSVHCLVDPRQCLIEDAFHLRPPCLSMLSCYR